MTDAIKAQIKSVLSREDNVGALAIALFYIAQLVAEAEARYARDLAAEAPHTMRSRVA